MLMFAGVGAALIVITVVMVLGLSAIRAAGLADLRAKTLTGRPVDPNEKE